MPAWVTKVIVTTSQSSNGTVAPFYRGVAANATTTGFDLIIAEIVASSAAATRGWDWIAVGTA